MKYNENNRNLRILIRGPQWIGDAILTIPAIRSVRQAYPDSYIALISPETSLSVFEDIIYVDKVIPYSEKWGFKKQIEHIKLLKSLTFDIAILVSTSLNSALIPFFARIPKRVGLKCDSRSMFLTKGVKLALDETHQIKWAAEAMQSAGIAVNSDYLELFVPQKEKDWADSFLQENGLTDKILIGLVPGARELYKRWNPNYAARLSDLLLKGNDNTVIILLGAPGEEKAGEIIESAADSSRIVNLIGKTTLKQSFALIERLNMIVCNDSGLMHAACALNTPVFALFGPTNLKKTAPHSDSAHVIRLPDLDCGKCNPKKRKKCGIRCLDELKPEYVFEQIKESGLIELALIDN